MTIPIPAGLNFNIRYFYAQFPGNMPVMSSAPDHYTIGYVISGDRKSITQTSISEQHAGEIGMLAPHILHRTVAMSDVPYERILIKYTYKMAEPFIKLVGKPVFDTLYEQHIHSFSRECQNKILVMMRDMLEEFENYNQFSECILQGMLTRLLITIMLERRPATEAPIHFPFENEQIMEATYYIDKNYLLNLSIIDVANYVNLSPSYFSKLFKKSMGSTYSQYLTGIRMQRALSLLTQTNESVSDIADKCGFSNSNYFCDVFKKKYKISPSEYRKKCGDSSR